MILSVSEDEGFHMALTTLRMTFGATECSQAAPSLFGRDGRGVEILNIKAKGRRGSTSCRLQAEDDNEEDEFLQRGLKPLTPAVLITVRCGFTVVSDQSSGRMQLPSWSKVPSCLHLRVLFPSSSSVEKLWMINYPKKQKC